MKNRSASPLAAALGSAALVLVAAALLRAQQPDLSKVEVNATHVAGSVWMLEGAGGNIGVSAGPDGVLIVDDQFAPLADKIRDALPFVDLESGGDVAGLARDIADLIVKLPTDAKLIPGHGPLSTLDDLKAYKKMLDTSLAIVRERVAAGKTLEEIRKEGMPAEWKEWGTGFIDTPTWLENVYRSLTKK